MSLLAQGSFVPLDDRRDALADAVEVLVGWLEQNGQIWGDAVAGWVDGARRVMCEVPARDALAPAHASPAVIDQREAVRRLCVDEPVWSVIGDGPGSTRRWQDEGGLYVFTHMFDRTSPVNAGSDGAPLPLYALPIAPHARRALVDWMAHYRVYDDLQISCGPLEIDAYRQLADPGAALSVDGRALAREVEQATGLPTYYYLHRYWGYPGEGDRPCPGCGQPWRARGQADELGAHGLTWFEFRCEPCRLVSHHASSIEDEGHAAIGAWPGARA